MVHHPRLTVALRGHRDRLEPHREVEDLDRVRPGHVEDRQPVVGGVHDQKPVAAGRQCGGMDVGGFEVDEVGAGSDA